MIDFQWEVGLELRQGHFIVQQKWIISVFRFCCCLSVNNEKITKYIELVHRDFGKWK